MEEILYSIEQVAERLGLHVKTVRNYVREGRLKAVRIGKQYRIAAADLAAMTGRPISAFEPEQIRRTRHVEVSSVVEVDAVSPELSDRVTNMLLAAASSRSGIEDDPLRVQTIYDPQRGRLKVILIGSLDNAGSLLKIIKALVEVEK
jgi:excisionase family DNA binding protein